MTSFTSFICSAAILAASFTNAAPSPAAAAYPASESDVVNLRIEGLTNTIYEAPIYSGPRNITTPSGGTHPCTGTNLASNPTPFATCTTALDAASKFLKFPYDGTFDDQFDDYFITSISTSTETATQFWGLLLNYQFTPVGGCQQETKKGDQVLWAFDAFSKNYFLKVQPAELVVKRGDTRSVTVTDGMSGVPIAGALIDGVTTDANGLATLTFPTKGGFSYKATRDDSIRSNALYVVVG